MLRKLLPQLPSLVLRSSRLSLPVAAEPSPATLTISGSASALSRGPLRVVTRPPTKARRETVEPFKKSLLCRLAIHSGQPMCHLCGKTPRRSLGDRIHAQRVAEGRGGL